MFETNELSQEERSQRLARPTLIIGLGGTGAEVLSRVRDRFYSVLGPLEQYPVVRYLWLDTDTVQANHVSSWYRRHKEIAQALKFQPHEKVELTVADTEAYLSHLKSHPQIARWIYPNLSAKTSISEGAGQIRAYGRLAFFHNIDQIRATLSAALWDLVSIEASRRAAESGLPTNSESLNVVLVGSVAGGTGSGTFLDTAYLVRQLLKQWSGSRKITLMGFLAMPSVFGSPATMGRLYANGYAALKELNHFNYSPPVERQGGFGEGNRSTDHDYTLWWAQGEERTTTAVSPFDVCYVVDGLNQGGRAASGSPLNETVFSMIADAIFQDFSSSEFAGAKRSARDNLLKELIENAKPYDTDDANVKLPKRHFAFGIATITFPYERVRRALAARLAGNVVDYWLRRSDRQMPVQEYLQSEFLTALNLLEEEGGAGRLPKREVLDALYRTGESGRTMELEMADRVRQLVHDVADTGMARDGARWSDLLRTALAKLDREWDGDNSADPKLWGDAVQLMRTNQRSYLDRVRQALDRRITEMINDQHYGIGFTAELLGALDHKLSREEIGYVATWRKEQKMSAAALTDLRTELGDVLADLDERWEMSALTLVRDLTLKKLLRRAADLAGELYQYQVKHFARTLAIETAETIRRWISPELPEGWGYRLARLQDALQDVQGRLKEREASFAGAVSDTREISLYAGAEQLEEIYQQYVPHPAETAQQLTSAASLALGVKLMEIPGRSHDMRALVDRLCKATEAQFAGLEEKYDVFTLFHKRYPVGSEEWRQKIEEMRKACLPWVAWDPGYTGLKDKVGAEKGRFILGLAKRGNDDVYRDFIAEAMRPFSGTFQTSVVDLNARNQIIFYTEVAGFALAQTTAVRAMREQYLKAVADGARDLHTDKDDTRFAELVVVSEDERRQIDSAARAFVLGNLLRLVVAKEVPSGRGTKDITYEYLQKQDGLPPEPRWLGNDSAVIPYLRSKRDSVLAALHEEITWRRAELQEDPEKWAQYAAVLRHWLTDVFPPKRLDMGSGITETVKPTETRVLEGELRTVMQAKESWPDFDERARRALQQLATFTVLDAKGRRVLDLPVTGALDPWSL